MERQFWYFKSLECSDVFRNVLTGQQHLFDKMPLIDLPTSIVVLKQVYTSGGTPSESKSLSDVNFSKMISLVFGLQSKCCSILSVRWPKYIFRKTILLEILFLAILVAIVIFTNTVNVSATDYCNPSLCYGYGKHVGCGNNGVRIFLVGIEKNFHVFCLYLRISVLIVRRIDTS